MTKLFLNKKISNRIANGHPWVFANEIDKIQIDEKKSLQYPEDYLAEVYTHHKQFVGRGYFNDKSQIPVRLLTREKDEAINKDFFYRKIAAAWDYRQRLGYTENCRLVFGEADGLPQLIIDKFNDYFVIQTMALGIDVWKDTIVSIINEIFSPKGIYERNDVPVRELEGLPQQKGFLSSPFDTNLEINVNPYNSPNATERIRFLVDVANGQKTGYFLDQQENRKAIQHIVKDAEVLGAFTYTGTFEIHAGFYGAKSVLGIDISENAVAQANRNAALNGLDDRVKFATANAFDMLKQWSKGNKQYDVVMLDPPAFTKSRTHIDKAISGYKEVNLRGMKLVRPGGFLVTSSCTNLVQPDVFLQTIAAAAKDARRRIRQVTFQAQAPDHPIIWNMENTNYLKFLIVQVL
ncbi:MAG: class I SAM-dependent rRNA methyltransferase [Niabella sp.]